MDDFPSTALTIEMWMRGTHRNSYFETLVSYGVASVNNAMFLAIDEGKKPFTRDGQPWCGPGFDNSFQKEAHRIRLNWDEEIAEHDNEFWATARAAQLVRSVGDMGCLQGVKARPMRAEIGQTA